MRLHCAVCSAVQRNMHRNQDGFFVSNALFWNTRLGWKEDFREMERAGKEMGLAQVGKVRQLQNGSRCIILKAGMLAVL